MMNRQFLNNVTNYFFIVSALFLGFLFYMTTVGTVDGNMFIYQILSLLISLVTFFIFLKTKTKVGLIFFILIFQLFISRLILFFDVLLEPSDVGRYQEEAKVIGNSPFFYDGVIKVVTTDNYFSDINDLGYISTTGFVYFVFGDYYAETIIIYLKLFFHLATILLFCKTLQMLSCYNKLWIKFVAIFWGINIYAVYFAISGLKENIFTFFISTAVYYLVRLIRRYSRTNLFFFLLATAGTFCFRLTPPLYFLGAYIGFLWLKTKSSRYIFILLLGIILIISIGYQLLLYYFPFMEVLSAKRMLAEEDTGSSFVAYNLISAFIGPYPSVLNSHNNVNLITSTYSIYHLGFSVFAILGIYHVIRERVVIMYPFFIVYFLNVCMMVLTGYSTNARYSYPFILLYYAFIPYGLSYYYKKKYYSPYLVGAILISFIYNIYKA